MTDAADTAGHKPDNNDELIRLRRELLRVQTQLDRAQRRKSSLLAMAAHDLRTPLAIIQGYAQLLEAETAGETDTATAEYVTNILAHSESLGHMIENLVALDQIESGNLRPSAAPYNLNELVEHALAQVEGLLKIKSLSFAYSGTLTPAWVEVDEHLIQRALYNMLSHASKYARPSTQLRVEIEPDGSYYRVQLHDPQRQLPPEMLAKLFDLAELNHDGFASLRGMDMGLVFTRHVVEQHGGRVAATCVTGHGMILALYLPVGKAEAAKR